MPVFTDDEILDLSQKPVLDDGGEWVLANPTEETQTGFVGCSFERAYREASLFLNYLFDQIPPDSLPKSAKILDFGCGWGRMLRLVKHNPAFEEFELFGADALPAILQLCARTIPEVWFSRTQLSPPTVYRSGIFDLIYAYSVFSHLSPENHLAWAQEFARITKPGGYVCVTTRPRRHIDLCESYRLAASNDDGGHVGTLGRFFKEPDCKDRYDAGEFLFEPTGGANQALARWSYGEAIVPRQFFEDRWQRFGFEFVSWDEGPPDVSGQCIVILRKN
jgi:SAM-dependent methyltransferase